MNVSLFVPFAKVIVALVRVCVVPVFVQVEQMRRRVQLPAEGDRGGVARADLAVLPLARATAVGAVCTGVAKMKTALVCAVP